MNVHRPRFRGPSILVWTLAAFFATFVAWAYNAPLDEIVRGPGVLVPSSNNQIVQSLEGGILDRIYVREGDQVTKGQMIAQLNQTKYSVDVRDFEGQIIAIEARILRLTAELDGDEAFKLPSRFWDLDPELALSEEQLFEARQSEHQTALKSAQEQLSLEEEQEALIRNMVAQEVMPAIELMKAQSAVLDARVQIETRESSFRLDRVNEVSELLTELGRLQTQVEQSRDQLERATLIAPANGIVNTLYTTTEGGVVQSGEPIFEITPLDDDLLVEVRIRPADIAFVAIGMDSTVKLSAYDYTVFGSLYGSVAQISADTFEDEQSATGEPYYKVLVEISPDSLEKNVDVFEMRPGMLADVELQVGEKTVMQYLITPLIKTTEAMREP